MLEMAGGRASIYIVWVPSWYSPFTSQRRVTQASAEAREPSVCLCGPALVTTEVQEALCHHAWGLIHVSVP